MEVPFKPLWAAVIPPLHPAEPGQPSQPLFTGHGAESHSHFSGPSFLHISVGGVAGGKSGQGFLKLSVAPHLLPAPSNFT